MYQCCDFEICVVLRCVCFEKWEEVVDKYPRIYEGIWVLEKVSNGIQALRTVQGLVSVELFLVCWWGITEGIPRKQSAAAARNKFSGGAGAEGA